MMAYEAKTLWGGYVYRLFNCLGCVFRQCALVKSNNVLQLKMFPIRCCYWSEFRPADSMWRKGNWDFQNRTASGYLPQPAPATDWIFYGIFFLSVWNSLVFWNKASISRRKGLWKHIILLAVEHRNFHHPTSSLLSPCQPMTAVHINLQIFFSALSSLLPGLVLVGRWLIKRGCYITSSNLDR